MSILRIGGIASGLDTDQIVRDLMRVERMKVDKLYQNRQLIEWKKEQFRTVINSVRSFRDNYFNVLKPQTNMLSLAALKKMQATVNCSDAGFDAQSISVTAAADAMPGQSTFQVIQSATAAAATKQGVTEGWFLSARVVSAELKEENLNFASRGVADLNLELTLDGYNLGNISLTTLQEKDYSEAGPCGYDMLAADLQSDLNAAIDNYNLLMGTSIAHVTVVYESGVLEIISGEKDAGSEITLSGGAGTDALALLGFSPGTVHGDNEGNRLSLSDTMEVVSGKLREEYGGFTFDEGSGDSFTLTINGVALTVNKTDTLGTVINNINNSKAGVRVSYSTFSDTFSVTAKETGDGYILTDDGGSFFTALGINVSEGRIGVPGRDAVFKINGFIGTRSSNTFSIEGITYSINKRIDEADNAPVVTISTTVDVEAIYNTLEEFVHAYNSLIEEINGKLKEERFRDFLPLTEEQKKEMRESDIEKWEEKAQSGLLRGQPALETMLRDMRRALFDMVGDLHLVEIGIQTSSNYREQGKLVLKDGGNALREAISENPDRVADLFTRRSAISYSPTLTAEQRAQRYEESGLAQRLSDILNDNIRTMRDSNGRKGILLEHAGFEGDTTQYNNYLDRQISDVNKRINRLNEMLQRKEEQYYRQFAAMEKALEQLYAQGDWLLMQINQFQSQR